MKNNENGLDLAGKNLVTATHEFVTQIRLAQIRPPTESSWKKYGVSILTMVVSLGGLGLGIYNTKYNVTDPDEKSADESVQFICKFQAHDPLTMTDDDKTQIKVKAKELEKPLERSKTLLKNWQQLCLLKTLDRFTGLEDEEKQTLLLLPDIGPGNGFTSTETFSIVSATFNKFANDNSNPGTELSAKIIRMLDSLSGPASGFSYKSPFTVDQLAELHLDRASILILQASGKKAELSTARMDLSEAETLLAQSTSDTLLQARIAILKTRDMLLRSKIHSLSQ